MEISAVIAGVQKCATTSLHEMLGSHPQVATHCTGQWPYFLHDNDYHEQYEAVCAEHFPRNDDRLRLVRDTSLSASEMALRRLRSLSPSTRIILQIRNPIDRAYSAYCFAKSKGYDPAGDFVDHLYDHVSHPDSIEKHLVHDYVALGFYHRTLQRIERYFPRDQVLVLRSEDLKHDPVAVCNRVFRFLGLPAFGVAPLERNPTRQPRVTALYRLIKNESTFKEIAKRVLPARVRRTLLRSIHSLNTTRARYPRLPEPQRRRLNSLYSEENALLMRDYGLGY